MSPNNFSQSISRLATAATVYHWAPRGFSLWTACGKGDFRIKVPAEGALLQRGIRTSLPDAVLYV